MAPAVGFEPTTNRLTADRSTTELRRNFRDQGAAIFDGGPEPATGFFVRDTLEPRRGRVEARALGISYRLLPAGFAGRAAHRDLGAGW